MSDFANRINEMMFELMIDCEDEQREEFAKLVGDWKKQYPRSWASVRDRQPIAFAFMDAVLSAERYVNCATEEDKVETA